ncbi:MAG: single-stranded-DNA-specific exonuclease RecJ [Eubacterium sp.]|nr:single-stranded-DNA-specific exonuclease RecJ [Eubacterium sp.]
MIETIWKKRKNKGETPGAAALLAEATGLSPAMAALLARRGYDTPEKAMAFLEPDVLDFHDPFGLPDMQRAMDRLVAARDKGELVCVHGDYDADGTTGVAILMKYFKQVGIKAFYEIPNRLEEGYGLNNAALDRIAEKKADLVLTVDNGIAAHDQAKHCAGLGMDLIISDHHECQGELPEALAVIDAKRPDSAYPFSELCGAGVALKIVQALDMALGLDSDLEEYIECAAVATVADIVPLVDENRIITFYGLESMNSGALNRGVRALIEVSELTEVSAGSLGFVIGPKINAAGRLGEADRVVELYLSEDDGKAQNIAAYLRNENKERQQIEQDILELARKQAEDQGLDKKGVMVVAGEGWHPGVIGIVASRLQEIWYRPAIVIGIDDKGVGKGSCRSVEGFNIFDALSSCGELFLNFGGHAQAAGFSIEADKIPALDAALNAYGDTVDLKHLLVKPMYYDGVLERAEISETLVEELSQMEPCGVGNPGPVFMMGPLTMENAKKMGSDKRHLMFSVSPYRCVGFGMGEILDGGDGGQFSILCKPEINCFRDKKSVQLLIKDIKRSPFSDNMEAWKLVERIRRAPLEALPELTLSSEEFSKITLDRNILADLYKRLVRLPAAGIQFDVIVRKFEVYNRLRLLLALNVLAEAGLIVFKLRRGLLTCQCLEAKEKRDIEKTPLMVKLRALEKAQAAPADEG